MHSLLLSRILFFPVEAEYPHFSCEYSWIMAYDISVFLESRDFQTTLIISGIWCLDGVNAIWSQAASI